MNDTATRGAPASRTLPVSRGGARSGGPRRSPRSTRGRAAPGPGMRRIIARAPRQPPAVSRLASITDALAQTEASTAPAARQEKCRGVALAGRRSRGRSRHDPPRWLDDGRAGGFLRSGHGKRHGPGRPAASPLTVRHAREARAGGHGNCSGFRGTAPPGRSLGHRPGAAAGADGQDRQALAPRRRRWRGGAAQLPRRHSPTTGAAT